MSNFKQGSCSSYFTVLAETMLLYITNPEKFKESSQTSTGNCQMLSIYHPWIIISTVADLEIFQVVSILKAESKK